MNKVPSTKQSFLELIKENNIVIPHLQRDYAQGRISQNEKLRRFVTFLKDRLEDEKTVNLDFIFGYFDESDNIKVFIPIDGQQRLTTIFLLHWYLALANKNESSFKESLLENGGSKFTYQTRIFSQEFINSIISNHDNIEVINEESFKPSESLKNLGWFYKPWQEDSTVQAMLNAIDTIHEVFRDICNLESYYSKLQKGLISFEFLNPDAIELSDEFYIKMNARGLPLSTFENFKVDFLDTISDRLGIEKQSFANKLDSNWSDAIWNWSLRASTTYDIAFHNFFHFIFQIFYSKEVSKDLANKYNLNEHYEEILNNVRFSELVSMLNLIADLDEKFEYEFEDFCFLDAYLKLFSSSNFRHFDKMRLYGLLMYQVKYGICYKENEDYIDFERIVSNVLRNTNQSKKRNFDTDLRTSRYKELIGFIDELCINKKPYDALAKMKDKNYEISREINKAIIIKRNPSLKYEIQRLEDHPYLKGGIHNFLFFFDEPEYAKQYVDIFYSLWSQGFNNDLNLYKALFSIGDYTVDVGGSGLGNVRYAGSHGKWNRVLSNTNSNEYLRQTRIFKKLFEYLKHSPPEDVFQNLQQIENPEKTNWRYYMFKYPEILEEHNLFVLQSQQSGSARIELLTKSILSTHHTGYLNRAVVLEMDKSNIKSPSNINSYSTSVSWSSIQCNDFSATFNGQNWEIVSNKSLENIEIDELIINAVDSSEKEYVLISDSLDLVNQMITFIRFYHT